MLDKRRLFAVLLFIVAALTMILSRIFWIQIVAAESYSSRDIDLVRSSVLQRERQLVLDSGRGHFYDRDGNPLTGETYPSMLVFPVKLNEEERERGLPKLLQSLGIEKQEWNIFREGLRMPAFWKERANGQPVRLTDEQAAEVRSMGISGVTVAFYNRRYPSSYLAGQLIGYIGQNPQRVRQEFVPMMAQGKMNLASEIGAAGLEKAFQPFLAGIGGTSISLFTDGRNRPLPGMGYRMVDPGNSYYPLKVITTLDKSLQQRLESLADKSGLKEGAIVVLDKANAEVLALISRPSYDPNNVDLEAAGWANRALKADVPGSIFKTVVAAAALEAGVVRPDETFECRGSYGKYHFSCWKKEGHGTLTFREGYAQSCNIVFGEVMKRLTVEQLENAARKLGVNRRIGWEGPVLQFSYFAQLDAEDQGMIWKNGTDPQDEGAKMQTAIGQRDVHMSPLQAANMVVTLLNGGQAQSVRAVKEIQYHNGRRLAEFPAQRLESGKDGISRNTGDQLLQWMRDVVAIGTGQGLKGAKWQLAGKSGTAQVTEDGLERINQWFIGYGPWEQPRYAVAVVSLRQEQSGNQAVSLFKGVMNVLADR